MMLCFVFYVAVSAMFAKGTVLGGDFKNYTGHAIVRVTPDKRSSLDMMKKMAVGIQHEMDFLKRPTDVGKAVDVRVSPEVLTTLLNVFKKTGIPHQVLVENVQSLIDQERAVGDSLNGTFNIHQYHTYDEIVRWLRRLDTTFSTQCRVFSIGNSYEGRPLIVIRIGNAAPQKPVLWIDAGIHAREWIAPATAVYLIAKLLEGGTVVTQLLRQYTIYVMPVANPDGYQYTWTNDRMWRKTRSPNAGSTCQGTDPNRNWNFHWAGRGTSDDPCSNNYRGRHPFSEPETLAMSNFLWRIRPRLRVYLSLHSYGQYWLTPWGFTYRVPSDYRQMIRVAQRAAAMAGRNNGTLYQVGSSARLLYLASGGSDDWAKGVARAKFAYTVELGDTGKYGFLLPSRYINVTGNEMFGAVKTLLNEARKIRQRQHAH